MPRWPSSAPGLVVCHTYRYSTNMVHALHAPYRALKVVRILPDARLPTKSTEHAAGWDLYCYENRFVHRADGTVKLRTGIRLAIPHGLCGFIRPRSSAFLSGLRVSGVIDSDYRGEVIVTASYDGVEGSRWIESGTRIAQLILLDHHPEVALEEVADLPDTARGESGFGSSGK